MNRDLEDQVDALLKGGAEQLLEACRLCRHVPEEELTMDICDVISDSAPEMSLAELELLCDAWNDDPTQFHPLLGEPLPSVFSRCAGWLSDARYHTVNERLTLDKARVLWSFAHAMQDEIDYLRHCFEPSAEDVQNARDLLSSVRDEMTAFK